MSAPPSKIRCVDSRAERDKGKISYARIKMNERRRPNEYFLRDQESWIKICVGTLSEPWILPEGLVSDQIPYFRAAFRGNFSESIAKEIWLKEDDPEAFAYVVDWLLGDVRGPEIGHKDSEDGEGQNKDWDAEQILWAKVYVVADKLGIPELEGIALLTIRHAIRSNGYLVAPAAVEIAYKVKIVALMVVFVDGAAQGMLEAGAERREFAAKGRKLDSKEWVKRVENNLEFYSVVNTEIERCKKRNILRDQFGLERP